MKPQPVSWVLLEVDLCGGAASAGPIAMVTRPTVSRMAESGLNTRRRLMEESFSSRGKLIVPRGVTRLTDTAAS